MFFSGSDMSFPTIHPLLSAIFCFFGCFLLAMTWGEVVDIDLSVDRSNWRNPNDPLFASSSMGNGGKRLGGTSVDGEMGNNNGEEEDGQLRWRLDQCQKILFELNASLIECRNSSRVVLDPTLKHVIRGILDRLDVVPFRSNAVHRLARIDFNSDQLNLIDRFLSNPNPDAGLREQIRYIFEDFIQVHIEDDGESWRWIARFVPYLPLLNIIILLPAVIVLMNHIRWHRSFVRLFLATSFFLSFATVYSRMYQEKVAARMSRFNEGVPVDCLPKGFFSQIGESLLSMIQMKSKSACLQYYEDRYVDVIWEVSLVEVIMTTISHFIFTPLGIFGRHANAFIKEYFADSPLHIFAVQFVLLILVFALSLFVLFGYRWRTWFWTIEPTEFSIFRLIAAVFSSANVPHIHPPSTSMPIASSANPDSDIDRRGRVLQAVRSPFIDQQGTIVSRDVHRSRSVGVLPASRREQ